MSFRKALFADNIVPPKDRIARARSIGAEIVRAVENRPALIKSHNLDPAFALPDANWSPEAPNDYLHAYRLLRTLEWDQIKLLRFRAQAFTGYNLLYMGGPGRCFDPVPADFDTRISDEPPADIIDRWRALIDGLPRSLIYAPPPMLGEVGWWVDDVLLNSDAVTYQERVSLLKECGALDLKHPRILEIGGGYGALASAITSAIPECDYWICDLPESLLFSGLYLSLIRDEPSVNLLPNYFFPRLVASGVSFDLVINTLSMSEMSVHQIEQYAAGISKLIGSRGVFFEQNQDNRHMGLSYCKDHLGRHFAHRRTLATSLPVHNGVTDIWSNYPA